MPFQPLQAPKPGAEYWLIDQSGAAAHTAWQVIPSGGVIWRLGDKLYLYGRFNYDYMHCSSGSASACTTTAKVAPYLYFTMNL